MSGEKDINRTFALVFSGEAGAAVLAELRRLTIEMHVPPDAPDATLRHTEGRRSLVRDIERRVRLGREGKP